MRNEAFPITPHPTGGTSSMSHPGSALYPQSSPVSDERGLGVRLNPATDLGQGRQEGVCFSWFLFFVSLYNAICYIMTSTEKAK